MKIKDLIAKLQSLPQYADVLISVGGEFQDPIIEMGDDHGPGVGALVEIGVGMPIGFIEPEGE